MLKYLLVVLSLNLWSLAPAFAQTDPTDLSASSEQILLSYDPSLLDNSVDLSLRERVQEQLHQTSGFSHSYYFIPLAPSNQKLLDQALSLPGDTFDLFLSKKQKFLQRISKGLIYLQFPKFLHNRILAAVNDQFYLANRAIAEANRHGVGFRLRVAVGAGLNDFLLKKIRATSLGKWVPETGGFYFLVSLGFGFSRITENGKNRIVFEAFSDVDSLKSVGTVVLLASVGGDLVFTQEKRDGSDRLLFLSGKATPAGIFRTSPEHLSYSIGAGVNFPPMANSLMSWDFNEVHQIFTQITLAQKAIPAEKIRCEDIL